LANRQNQLRRQVKLTPEGWVFLVVLAFITVGAVLRSVNLLVVMAGMMYVSLLINWRLAIHRLKTLSAKRRFPAKLHSNQLSSFQWSCQNNSRRVKAWNLVVRDRIERVSDDRLDDDSYDPPPPKKRFWTKSLLVYWFSEIFERVRRRKHVSVSDVEACFPTVGTCQSEVQSYRAYFGQRGKYLVGPARLSTTFPFGLIVSRIDYPEIEPFFVGPAIGKLDPTWEKRVQSSAVGSEAVKRRRSIEEDEFYALRPWRSGDSKKNIHWRSTAKKGLPVVKQYDQQNNRDFGLMLDLYSEDGADPTNCELAISFAATTLFDIKHDVQGQVALGVCGEETVICSSRSQQGIISDAIRSLAIARSSQDPEIARSVARVASLISRGTPIYIVSSREKPDVFEADRLGEKIKQLSSSKTSSRVELKALRALKQFIPFIRWIHVESQDFKQMFSMDSIPNEKELQRFTKKITEQVSK